VRLDLRLGLGVGRGRTGGGTCRQVLNFKGSTYVDLPDIAIEPGQTISFSYALAGGIPTSNEYFLDGDNGTRPIFRIGGASQIFQGLEGISSTQGSLDGESLVSNWPSTPIPQDVEYHQIMVVAETSCVLSRIGIAGGNFAGFNGQMLNVKIDDGSEYYWRLNEGAGTTVAVNSGSAEADGTYFGVSSSDWEEVC
jgi:hypothetical protein